ncbi:MAG: hypothetical protein GY869_00020, partial [Planctomycetes bacterium]|nr:hypothetical protein [Planctomycetota bacterium]
KEPLTMNAWHKEPLTWIHDRTFYISIPFTWNLPRIRMLVKQRSFYWESVVVGGPAVELMPDYFNDLDYVAKGLPYEGMLQLYNPMATRTTTGCDRSCKFCAVPQTEGRLKELDRWPDQPILVDNNLLASSQKHFDKVVDRLVPWGLADFNQGLDIRYLNQYHAERIAEIKRPIVRLALDSINHQEQWLDALELLFEAGIKKYMIRCHALIGYDSDPAEAWERCNFIEAQGVKVSPNWFHPLDLLKRGKLTEDQKRLGWSDYERRRIMQWFYQHKKAKDYG